MLSRHTTPQVALIALTCVLSAGCSKGTGTTDVSADPATSARVLYTHRCASCHGSDGRGQGPLARSLPVKPRAFTSASWQSGISDQHIEQVILRGGESVGRSALMPPNPDLASDRRVLEALVGIIRGFKSASD